MILNSRPLPPRQRRRELSQELERIILKCLEKKPDKRYESAAKLMAALNGLEKRGPWTVLRRLVIPALSALVLAATLVFVLDLGGVRQRAFPVRIRTLAVLPLENLSRDPDQEFFAEGLTEELISILGNVAALRVISRESAMTYRNTTKRLPQIARELGVDNLLLGSVQRVADTVRIRVRLVKADDERQLWSNSYDSGLADVLTLQSQLAQAIARELRARISTDERTRLRTTRAVDPAVHDAYLRGRYHLSRYDEEGWRAALHDFQEAIRQDPTYAPAYAGLADSYHGLSSIVLPPSEAMSRSRAAALKALEIDSTLAEAYVSLGGVLTSYDWKWGDGERAFKRALALNPGSAGAHGGLAGALLFEGRFSEAMQELDIARELDPLSTGMSFSQLTQLNMRRRDNETIAAARAQIEAEPGFFGGHLILGQALLRKRAYREALAELHEANRLMPNPFFTAWIAYGYATAGKRDSAEVIRHQLEEQAKRTFVQAYGMAIMYVALGEKDMAFEWLHKGIEQRSEEMEFIKIDPAMDPLRSDPRFAEIVRKVGFTP
jgi:TolB-like protein/Flp pilus assembly protein TadD